MFESKKKELFSIDNDRKVKGKENAIETSPKAAPFVEAALKESAVTLSDKGAKKYATTGDAFIDQFGNNTHFRSSRPYDEIGIDQSKLWASDPRLSIAFILFLRTITRVTALFNGIKTATVQRGLGYKHDSIIRMIWLHLNHPDAFWKNIQLMIVVGSWKDIIQMLQYDLVFNGWENRMLDWPKFKQLILAGLANENQLNLVKKYLPQIKTRSKCKTVEAQADNLIGKWIAEFIRPEGMNKTHGYKHYRQTKSNGTAHLWQQLISQGKHLEIDFSTVHGRALALMVGSKYIENQGLTAIYTKWIESQPVAKFTGYPHELFKPYLEGAYLPAMQMYQEMTLNKQFKNLVETAKENAVTNTSMIVVRDTSGSMNYHSTEMGISCNAIAKSIALFFSEMLPDGHFSNAWIEFNRTALMHKWIGSTVAEKWRNDRADTIGTTDFQSVVNLFCEMRDKGIPESDFPNGIICVSDNQLNPVAISRTNVEEAFRVMKLNGFSQGFLDGFKIVFWNLTGDYYSGISPKPVFETYGGHTDNVFYFSGYDPSIIAFLIGVDKTDNNGNVKNSDTPKNASELLDEAMDQEILNMVQL